MLNKKYEREAELERYESSWYWDGEIMRAYGLEDLVRVLLLSQVCNHVYHKSLSFEPRKIVFVYQ